jgi:DegV family protein with EDD domain
MTIKIVTDSSSDIPLKLREELGISVVPLYVRYGNETFKDGVTISNDEFYRRLVAGEVFPNTIQPSPMDFKQTFEELIKDADGIVSIHLSDKFSGTAIQPDRPGTNEKPVSNRGDQLRFHVYRAGR